MDKRAIVCLLVLLVFSAGVRAGDDAVVTSEQFIEKLAAPTPAPIMRTRSFAPIKTRGLAPVARKPAQIAIPILFKSGSTQVADETSRRQMAEVGKALCSQALRPYRFEIAGHTDSVGTSEYNRRLSRERARALKDYLCHTFSIDPDRLEARGYGESEPVATNDTPEGRAKNRRVVFKRLD